MRRSLSFFSLFSLTLLLFTACTGSSDDGDKKDEDESGGEAEYENMRELDLSKQGVHATIQVPKKDPDKNIRPAKLEASNMGGAVINAGKVFKMKVMQVPPRDIEEKKTDIKNMSQLDIEFVQESDSLLIYKESVPDGEKEMFSFYLVKEAGGKPFIFESVEAEFTRDDVDRMIRSAKSVQPKKADKAA